MINLMGMVLYFIRTEINIKEILKIILQMDMEFTHSPMALNIKVILSIIKLMELVNKLSLMAHITKVNLYMGKDKVMVN